MATNAQHQASYRARQASAGAASLTTLVNDLESDFNDWKEARHYAKTAGAAPEGFASQENDARVSRVVESLGMSKICAANISKELSRISVFM